jgi:predicted DNA-binding antitoxin AbrB/MazE fold protein
MVQQVEAVYEKGYLRPIVPLREVSEGQRVRLTVELATGSIESGKSAVVQLLDAQGMLEHPAPPDAPYPKDWNPLTIAGESLSESVIKMRREG